MHAIQRFLRRPLMYWRSRGFGIHSPFAYALIREVLAEKGEYYAYARLREAAAADFRFNSLIHRLVCRFTPESVLVAGCDDAVNRAISMADSRIEFVADPSEAQMVIFGDEGEGVFSEVLSRVKSIDSSLKVDSGTSLRKPLLTVVIRNLDRPSMEARWIMLCAGARCGMAFSNGLTGILCLSPHLPRQSFVLSF